MDLPLSLSPRRATPDGWNPITGPWSYASATTITVPSGAASIYQKDDKIKLTQTTVKYFRVTVVADTLLTVWGLGLYTVADAAITSPFYSKAANPQGWVFNKYPSCSLQRTTVQSVVNSGNGTAIQFNSEVFDYGNMFDSAVSTSRITAPVSDIYFLDGFITWATNANGRRGLEFEVNDVWPGNYRDLKVATATGTMASNASIIIELSAGDYVELVGWQDSGGALNTVAGRARFDMTLIG